MNEQELMRVFDECNGDPVEFARRLLAEQGEQGAWIAHSGGRTYPADSKSLVMAKHADDSISVRFVDDYKRGDWWHEGDDHDSYIVAFQLCKAVPINSPAAPPTQDALDLFLKECEAEAAHIEKNGSNLRIKFGDEQQKGEPVAFVSEVYQSRYTIELNGHDLAEGMPLYAAHPQDALDGMVTVPREPTEAMSQAGEDALRNGCIFRAETVYRAMLDAAMNKEPMK